MISFVPLWEGDICSPNLWWDHRNCCTSLCSLQIRAREASLASIPPTPPCLSCRMTEKGQGWDISWTLHCALPCMVHRGGGERGWKELWDELGSCAMQLLRKQSWWRSGLQNSQVGEGSLSACPAPACRILAARYDFCYCLEKFSQ